MTNFPLVQSSGLKGKLRAEATDKLKQNGDTQAQKKIDAVFGPEDSEYAGALSPGDARLLLFPIRSLVGVFAWATCPSILARVQRDWQAANKTLPWSMNGNAVAEQDNNSEEKQDSEQQEQQQWGPDGNSAWTVDDESVVANKKKVVLDEFAFTATVHSDVKEIAAWLADECLPQSPEYDFFRKKVRTHLVILPDDDFRDFTQFATEVITRIRMNPDTRTAAGQALWTEEHLPSDSLLYAPLHASRSRAKTKLAGLKEAKEVADFVRNLDLTRIQLGGDETVGRGIVRLHISGGTS